MKILNGTLLAFLLTVVSGCSILRPEPVETVITKEVFVQKLPLEINDPAPFEWKDTIWMIITPEIYEAKMSEMKKSGKSFAIFALDAESYESLSINISEILKYMEEQKYILDQYREYYEPKDISPDSQNLTD